MKGEVTRGARAVVVCPQFRARDAPDAEARLEEAKGLALAIGIVVADAFIVPIREARAATLFGEGQVQNIAVACEQSDAELVIVDGALSAIQQRNLEEKLKRKVIDRTGLILEIFGERAATAEGRLQVELAHRRAGWSAAGLTWNASAAASVFSVVPAKRRSRPTAA